LSKGRSLNFIIISKVRKLKKRSEEVTKKIRNKPIKKVEEIKEDHNKGIVKKLIILNCSLFLAPEKNPKRLKREKLKRY